MVIWTLAAGDNRFLEIAEIIEVKAGIHHLEIDILLLHKVKKRIEILEHSKLQTPSG